MTLGARVSSKRKEKRFTQEALAQKLGVSAAYVSQIENEQRIPSYALLIKLSSVLDSPISYFWGTQDSSLREPSTQLIHTAIRFLSSEEKGRVIDYIYQITGSQRFGKFPMLNDPTAYADYLLRHLKYDVLPIDPLEIASRLSISVIYSSNPLLYEGMVYKSTAEPSIILDGTIENVSRRKFTVAMMIGHLVIPWHMRPLFAREKGKRSLDQEDQLEIEAREFAGELMIPSKAIAQDMTEKEVSLESIEQLARDKYDCSMMAFIHKFNARYNKMTAFLTSENGTSSRMYNTGCPFTVLESPGESSFVRSFMANPPEKKEYRKGFVEATAWIKEPPPKLKVYEESLLDPKQGVVVTLLRFST